jgi:hypothetical protein
VEAVQLDREQEGLLRTLSNKIMELSLNMEKMKLAEYVKLLDNPRRLLYVNFLAGLGRGVGIAVGFTILGAVVLYFFQMLVRLNLPLVGGFIAEIVRMVQLKLGP